MDTPAAPSISVDPKRDGAGSLFRPNWRMAFLQAMDRRWPSFWLILLSDDSLPDSMTMPIRLHEDVEAEVIELATIGYEGADIDDFVATLQAANIALLIDVRELPISRRRGFAKSALSSALADVGISYLHLRGLGDPKAGREAARAGNYRKFRRIFERHLSGDAAQCDLEIAISRILEEHSCLMCYERDPSTCHRSIVAATISGSIGAKITHLGVMEGAWKSSHRARPRTGVGAGQGAAACGR